ncbi:MAG: LptA/OstA family protein [Pseudomonadota bacterium]
MTRRIMAARAAFLATLLAAPTFAAAQIASNEDCKEPIDIGGEKLEVVDSVATLTGAVRVVQCGALLSTEKLVAKQNDSGEFEILQAEGAVRYSNAEDAISSRTAVYDLNSRTITFTDEVVVVQGRQVMTGDALIYWIDTGQIRFTAESGKRVRGIFHTQSLDVQL